jgi:N-carbamoylputrescine amidase
MTDETGEILEDASRDKEEILLHSYDLQEIGKNRLSWGLFRDRRPEMYGTITE